MLKKLKCKKGSALTYVLIIMMLLSILGLSLISSTVINFKVNRQSNSFNKSFYITDGAIDETLAELREITYRAEADASNWINDPDADFREEAKWKKFFNNVNLELESGELTTEEIVELTQTALKREFTKQYYLFLLEVPSVNGPAAHEILQDDGDYELYDSDNNFVKDSSIKLKSTVALKSEYYDDLTKVSFKPNEANNFDSASIEDITLVQEIKGDYFSLKITSNGAYNESEKVIEVMLDVIVPNYNYIVSTKSKNIQIKKNEALTNAVMAREDILILDGKVTVNGDIYAYGTLPNVHEYSYTDVGGILVGADKTNVSTIFSSIGAIDFTRLGADNIKGELSVDGDIQSRSSLRINGVNSRVDSTGNIFANSYVVDKSANNFIGSNDKNLYIMEDMLLFGDDSNIRVGKDGDLTNGELWTFLEGSPSGSNKGIRDLSGSIIINNNSDGLKLTTNNYFVSGVAYIDIYRNEKNKKYREYYQSGESFTTNNSNNFYTRKIASTDKSTDLFEYTIATGPDAGDTTNAIETYKTVLGEKVIVQDVNYKATHLITKNNEIISGHESFFSEISDTDKSIFTINSLKSTNNHNNYALGVVLGNNSIYNPHAVVGSEPKEFVNMAINDFVDGRKTNVEIIDKKINLLATRDYTTGRNKFEKFDTIFNIKGSTAYSNLSDANNFVFINENPDKNIYLNIPSTEVTSIKTADPDSVVIASDSAKMTISGAILTKGNIIINNESMTDFVFNGALISEKNIVMYGSGKKVINSKSTSDSYSPQLVKALARNKSLFNATNSDVGKKVEVGNAPGQSFTSRSIDGNLIVNIVDNDETINPTINSNVLLEGIIKTDTAKTILINSWKEID